MNIVLTIAYDGTRYLGWQKAGAGPSIEQTLQDVLEKILNEKIGLQAASRTDAGVHASAQTVNFISNQPIDLYRLQGSLNRLLPKDLIVRRVEEGKIDFHPTIECLGKEYHYHVCYGPVQIPQHRFYSWHYPYPLNVENMLLAAKELVGTRDFSSFCNVRKNFTYDSYVRTVSGIEISEIEQDRLRFKITGTHFLYKMVRNLVGTLLCVGSGKLKRTDMRALIENKNREFAGVAAAAHGLTLHKVFY